MIQPFSPKEFAALDTLVQQALLEDCPTGDITSDTFLQNIPAKAQLIAKQDGIFFGRMLSPSFERHFKGVAFDWHCDDGQYVHNKDILCFFSCSLFDILKLERIFLNFLQRLSGVATQTHRFVQALNDPHIAVMDTRKTTPLFRFLERRAVQAGGGVNHRYSLSDMVLLKENHLSEMDRQGRLFDLGTMIHQFKTSHPDMKVEVEIETLDQLRSWPLENADILMFDNFSLDDVSTGITICQNRGLTAQLEISGNITLATIAHYRHLPIHRISTGSLTHSVPALDLSVLMV